MIGQRVSHYEVLEKIGGGGMGVVYRARDVKLDRLVALKFLPVELSRHEEQKQRFIQEAKAASGLDHPNICTIHAIEEADDGQLFIAMAYYDGVTVESRIAQGPVPPGEIVEVALQVASGLAAAHDRGIVHRDIKPANLILTRDGTVKILDFGLSKFLSRPSNITEADTLLGSASYMSPEQVHGHEIGPQTDVWALGVVLYEMATGARPFDGSNKMSVLYAVAHREPPGPSEKNPDLPPDLEAIILRCLAKEPAERYPDMTVLSGELKVFAEISDSVTLVTPGTHPWIFRQSSTTTTRLPANPAVRLSLAAGGVAVVGLLVWMLLASSPRMAALLGGKPAAPELDGRQGVVLVGFRGQSGSTSDDWIGTAIGEILRFELPTSPALRWSSAKPKGSGSTAVRGNGFAPENGFDESALSELRGDHPEATLALGGWFEIARDKADAAIRLGALVQDLRSGEVRALLGSAGDLDQSPDLTARVADDLAKKFGIDARSRPRVSTTAAAADPSDPEAARLLAQARARLRILDALEARSFLEKALEIEPRSPLLHDQMAAVFTEIGHRTEIDREAQLAAEYAAGQPRSLQLFLRARWLETQDDWQEASAVLRLLRLAGQLPPSTDPLERLDAELHVASVTARAGDADAALAILEPLRLLHPEEPRIALVEAEAARFQSRYPEQQQAAERAAALASGLDAPMLVGQALLLEGNALRRLGDPTASVDALNRARQIFLAGGNRRDAARSLILIGNLKWGQQDLLGAKASYEEGARLSEAVGDGRLQGRTLVNKALVLRELGDLGVAEQVFRQGLEFLRPLEDRLAVIQTLVNLGETAQSLGHAETAEQAYAESLALLDKIDRPDVEAIVLRSYGSHLLFRGDLVEARRRLDRALAIQVEIGDEVEAASSRRLLAHLDYYRGDLDTARAALETLAGFLEKSDSSSTVLADVRVGLSEVLRDQNHLPEARACLERTLQEKDASLNPSVTAGTRLGLAELLDMDGRPAEAETLARQVLADLASSHELPTLSRARGVLASSLLNQGQASAAEVEIRKALDPLQEMPSLSLSLPLEITSARIQAALGRAAAANEILTRVQTTATTAGFAGYELEARLALGEIELASGSDRAGRARLRDIAEEARRKVFLRIEERATAALHATAP